MGGRTDVGPRIHQQLETAQSLEADDPAREAAIWHNRVFNPALPDTVQVLAFKPDWKTAEIKN